MSDAVALGHFRGDALFRIWCKFAFPQRSSQKVQTFQMLPTVSGSFLTLEALPVTSG